MTKFSLNKIIFFRIYTILSFAEGILVFIVLLSFPSTPNKALFFGLSGRRLLLQGGISLLSMIFAWLIWKSHQDIKWTTNTIGGLEAWIGRNLRLSTALVIFPFMALLFSFYLNIVVDNTFSKIYTPALIARMAPIILWLILLIFQTVFMIFLISNKLQKSLYLIDILLFGIVFLLGMIIVAQLSGMINPIVFDISGTFDTWFDADNKFYYSFYTKSSKIIRVDTAVHPIFPLIFHLPVMILHLIIIDQPDVVSRIITSINAGAWMSILFVLLRALGCRRLDALIFTCLGSVSAAAVFFLVIPESYGFTSITIMLALIMAAYHERQKISDILYIGINVLTLGGTVTTWAAGMIVTLFHKSWKKTIMIISLGFITVVALWGFQRYLYPEAKFFLNGYYIFGRENANKFINKPAHGGPLVKGMVIAFHSMVMPQIQMKDRQSEWLKMSVQHSLPGSSGELGMIATILWGILLLLGFWALFSTSGRRKFRLILGLIFTANLTLFLIYGRETFLYTLIFIPIMIAMIALSTQTKWRRIILIFSTILIVLVAINNTEQFLWAMNYYDLELGKVR